MFQKVLWGFQNPRGLPEEIRRELGGVSGSLREFQGVSGELERLLWMWVSRILILGVSPDSMKAF